MSLFKSRDWWNANCGIDETFGSFHMCIANYESTVNGAVKQIIIVGSLEGYLRIYDPKPPSSSETSCLSDLQLETQLALPVLAVLSGRFNNTEGLHVAVLHPMHLRVLRIVITENTEVNSHCTVDFMYEHRLPLHGYTLIAGPSNMLCVQSLTEGTLMFFENERVGVICKLSTLHILPSPICYVSSTESFIVSDSSWNLQSYSYQSLANSTVEHQSSKTPCTSRKLLFDWEFELGEAAIDIQHLGSNIVALGERHLYCLKDSDGTIVWTRKLDYHPMCITLLTPPDFVDSVVVLICTDASTLIVYKDNIVEWNCKLPATPLVIKTAIFQSIKGLIVTLTDFGQLNILYMGTQQVEYSFLQAPQRPINYERGMKEVQQLKKSLHAGHLKELNPKEKEIELDLKFDAQTGSEYLETQYLTEAIKGNLIVAMPKNQNANIRVFFTCDPLIVATPSEACLQLNGEGQHTLPIMFHAVASKCGMVASLCVEVSVVTSLAGASSVTQQFNLPLQLVMKPSVPVREALVKITLSANQPAASLAHLFQDFAVDEPASNLIALKHLNGTVVSILVSKTTNKYRLQSDSLAALAVLVDELQRRLRLHFSASSDLKVCLDSPLPVQETWSQIETHYSNYVELKKETIKLGQATHQFQIIQRVFHNKILSTKTVGLTEGNFAAVQLAHEHVTLCIQQVERFQEDFKNATYALEGSLKCILTLLNMEKNSSVKTRSVRLLEKALLPVEQLDSDQSWHQIVESKLNYLVRQRFLPAAPMAVVASNSDKEFNLTIFKKIFLQALDNLIKDPQS